ncbi:MAG: hypothetical protein A2622_10580 [Bdellovibrionales bacterium RIFCSPHIGHO2_01_FULL_40_29]|nr:MAG: hypothetical protein A2622_10580 [Bdellovibrionales bacterium RIFCSPHIGHO2_01_FULL_40_29]OFZ34405.1 MAG: hypothetical protein A3D17_00845 [Bdellovibrionales bacterium RIFCSPHIGHO2_02_FULL_40_15]
MKSEVKSLDLFFIVILLTTQFAASMVFGAESVDEQLLQSLNSEAKHDLNRRQSFKKDKSSKKIFEDEREKDLSLFLEDQEKWELIRERGLIEHRRQKKVQSPSDDGPEFKADLKAKLDIEKKRESARIQVVRTRERIAQKFDPNRDANEMEELDLVQKRPRFETRKRGQSKWAKGATSTGSQSSSGSSSSGSGFSPPPPAAFDEFPPQPDFQPPATDGFEEIPPPPPPINYDSSPGYSSPGYGIDSGFGDIPPPPPPPSLDGDF